MVSCPSRPGPPGAIPTPLKKWGGGLPSHNIKCPPRDPPGDTSTTLNDSSARESGPFGRPGTVPSNPSEPCQSTCPLRPVSSTLARIAAGIGARRSLSAWRAKAAAGASRSASKSASRSGRGMYDPERQHARQAAAQTRHRRGAAQLPVQLLGLGRRANRRAARGVRARPGARQQRPRRGRLPANRPVRGLPRTDGCLGRLSRVASGPIRAPVLCHRTCPNCAILQPCMMTFRSPSSGRTTTDFSATCKLP